MKGKELGCTSRSVGNNTVQILHESILFNLAGAAVKDIFISTAERLYIGHYRTIEQERQSHSTSPVY